MLSSLLSDLTSSALIRIGSGVFSKYSRIRRIDQALKGRKVDEFLDAKSLSDLETIIGHHYGELTELLHEFLEELQRTSLVARILQEQMLKIDDGATRTAFLQLHKKMLGEGNGNAEELYEVIRISFGVTAEAFVQDRSTNFLMKAMINSFKEEFKELKLQIGHFSKGKSSPTFEEINDCIVKIAKSVNADVRKINIETNKGRKKVDINKIYTPSDLFILPKRTPTANLQKINAQQSDDSDIRLTYNDFKGTFSRAVVLGDPGGGKSTLCQFISYEFSKNILLQNQFPTEKRNSPNLQRLPLIIVLRKFEKIRKTKHQMGIFEYIINMLEGDYSIRGDVVPATVEYLLGYGRSLIVFDGLDEVLDVSNRREYADLVERFCDAFPLCPTIVTSRIVGYDEAPLSESFAPVVVAPFSTENVEDYVTKFMQVVENKKKSQAALDAVRFREQTERSTDLRQNPLMLSLMSYLYAVTGDVPPNRPEIYRECALLMFEKWDQNRDIRANIPKGFDLLDLFSHVASKIYGNVELEPGVTRAWLTEALKKYFYDVFESKAKTHESVQLICDFLVGRAWVMSEFGPNTFKFTHRTFLEYFVARHLAQKHQATEELLSLIFLNQKSRRMDFIFHLALQIKTFRDSVSTARACNVMIQKITTTSNANFLSFVAESLEYLVASEQDIRKIVDALLESIFSMSSPPRSLAFGVLHDLLNAVEERRDFSRQAVADRFRQVLGAGGSKARIAFELLCGMSIGSYGYGASRIMRAEREWAHSLIVRFRGAMLALAKRDSELAARYILLFNEEIMDLIKLHGSEIIYFTSEIVSGCNPIPAVLFWVALGADMPETMAGGIESVALNSIRKMASRSWGLSDFSYSNTKRRSHYVTIDGDLAKRWLTRVAKSRDANLFVGLVICLHFVYISPNVRVSNNVSSTSKKPGVQGRTFRILRGQEALWANLNRAVVESVAGMPQRFGDQVREIAKSVIGSAVLRVDG